MKTEFRNMLIVALRSGRYQQAQSRLHKAERFYIREGREHEGEFEVLHSFCCLGVACDLLDPNQWRRAPREEDCYGYFDIDDVGLPNENITHLTERLIGHESPHVTGRLAALNDNGFSFAEIADMLEAGVLSGYQEKERDAPKYPPMPLDEGPEAIYASLHAEYGASDAVLEGHDE